MSERSSYRFGPFTLEPGERRLCHEGHPVAITPKAFDTLWALVEHHGRLMTKDALLKRVWPDAFVEEVTLAQSISVLRKVLGDTPENPRYIETVPKRGYRFIGDVSSPDAAALPPAPYAGPVDVPPTAVARAAWKWMAALLVAILLLGGWSYFSFGNSPRPNTEAGRIRLIVLPFTTLGVNADDAYVSEVLTDELITQLGSLQPDRLGVIARTTAIRYRSAGKSIAEIGRELSVGYVLTGSVQREGQRRRVNVQLIQVRDQTQLWSESFDQNLGDMLAMQTRIARAAAHQIQLKLSLPTVELRARRGTSSPQAFDHYQRANYSWNKRDPGFVDKAMTHYRAAIAADPQYAEAWAEMSRCLLSTLDGTPEQTYVRSADAARIAIGLDDALADGHFALATAALHLFDWETAAREFRRAEALDPMYVNYDFQVIFGHFDDAIANVRRGVELDPANMMAHHGAGINYFYARKFKEAISEFQQAIELEPTTHWSKVRLGQAYAQLGLYDEAIAALKDIDPLGLGTVHAMAGRRREALAVLRSFINKRGGPSAELSWEIALTYAALNEKDEAFQYLDLAYEVRAYQLIYLKVDPRLDPLRNDSRFAALERLIRFPPL